jgi:hypothetical protein
MKILTLGSVSFVNRGESQISWIDRFWTPVGQSNRYALAGNIVISENQRQGRPITLTAELPWSWLEASTVAQLQTIASQVGQTHTMTVDTNDDNVQDESYTVMFSRNQSCIDLVPIDQRRLYFTGTIYLVEI